jgi:DNA-binding SARP family transcriptional activator
MSESDSCPMDVRLEVFGGVRVVGPDGVFPLSPQVTRLLAVLLAEAGRVVTTERIIERVWPTDAPVTATKVVHVGIGKLRRVFGTSAQTADAAPGVVLRTVVDGYVLDARAADLDEWSDAVATSERLATADPVAALAAVDRACMQWRDRPWGGLADEPWLEQSVRALELQRLELEEVRSDLVLRTGITSSAIVELEDAAEREPLRERRWAQLMLGLYRSGRQADALRAYQRARDVLQAELGLEPGVELRRLELSILQHDPTLERATGRPDDVSAPTSFVGRIDELQHLARALDRERLVTVVGIGGIGKSRLVREFVHRHWPVLRSRTVTLHGVETPARLDAHIATQLGVFLETGDELLPVLAASLGRDGMLLVVDGAESFPEAVGAIALDLLGRCRGLRIIVTSRVPLGIGSERTIGLEPLPRDEASAASEGTDLALMLDRAGYDAVALDDDSLRQLRDACAAAGGVPLLVELAARTFEFGAPTIATAQDAHDLTSRAIAHSLDALDATAVLIARRGAVLPSGLSEGMAAGLAGIDVSTARRSLRQLAWLHLVEATPARTALRYRSLDPIRAALQAELNTGEAAALRSDAAIELQRVVDRIWPDRLRPVSLAALDEVDDEHDNLRFVLDDRLLTDPDRALSLAIAGAEYWGLRGHTPEGRAWLDAAIVAAEPEGPRRWEAELAYARSTRTMAEVAQRRTQLETASSEARGDREHEIVFGAILVSLAIARGWTGDRAGAAAALAELGTLDAGRGSPWFLAHLEHLRALDLALAGDFPNAREKQRRFAERMLEFEDPISAATGFYLAATLGDMGGALDLAEDITPARELATTVRDVFLLSRLLLLEARVQERTGDARGRARLAQAAEDLERQGGVRAAALARRDLGLAAIAAERPMEARDPLLRAARVLAQLDASAARPAFAGLARLAMIAGERDLASQLAARALALPAGERPIAVEDDQRVEKLLVAIEPAGSIAIDDDEVLDRCTRIAL